MSEITEKTLIPISAISVIAGSVFWLTSMWQKVEAHEKLLKHVETQQDNIQSKDEAFKLEVIERLSRIETKIHK